MKRDKEGKGDGRCGLSRAALPDKEGLRKERTQGNEKRGEIGVGYTYMFICRVYKSRLVSEKGGIEAPPFGVFIFPSLYRETKHYGEFGGDSMSLVFCPFLCLCVYVYDVYVYIVVFAIGICSARLGPHRSAQKQKHLREMIHPVPLRGRFLLS